MSRVSTDADITESGDLPESVSPPLKKPKIDPKAEVESQAGAEAEVPQNVRILLRAKPDDPEYTRQLKIYREQFEKSEGYDVDWDNLDYYFHSLRFENATGRLYSELSNEELMDLLIKTAIDEENEENGTHLELVEYVSANLVGVKGLLFYITFRAKDLSSTNQEPKLYQTKVRKFCDEILVREFRLKPAQE